ncbi:MAG: response regulator [Planctomycetes bacterium]|nr:response regulator [Planctomycetota bacterium]
MKIEPYRARNDLAANGCPMRVLVIEDDADTRDNLCDILELDDFQVDTAATGAEALAYGNWPEVSAVILDGRLPDSNAQELLPQIGQLAPQAAVIIATGYADLDSAISALRQGAADYLIKPVNAGALRASLSRIVDKIRTESSLQENQRRLREERDFVQNLWDSAQTILLLLDPEGRIVRFNPYLETLSGYHLAEVQGQDWFTSFVAEKDRADARRAFQDVLINGRLQGKVSPIQTRAGLEREIHWFARVLKDVRGDATGVLASGQDITELKSAQERALQKERLAAIGETMAGLVHESGNALQRTGACLEMLRLEVEDRPEAVDLVDRALRAQVQLHQLYEEVRQYAAPINLRRDRCDLAETWQETWVHLAEARREKNLTLREEINDVDLCCWIDRRTIGQVWRNILENAIYVSPESSVIVIRCTATTWKDRPAVEVAICDQGPGLTPEQRRRIFEPFFTTKTKGTGLGMAIVQRIIQSHGGSITVCDHPGQGAEIRVILPRGES